MAFSPTPSHASSSSSVPLTPSKFESLPIMAMRDKIVEKIMQNRVTLIVGETGCGKTSQVPLFLREEGMVPIICTQPRRFAVVAVAKTVAQSLQCEVGDEVGYHIGHSRVISPRTKIVYKTAGVLLEEMRQIGFNALKYKVIILDEVHERSIESDLALVCLKQFLLRKADIRLVLMSATADISRYKDYFKDLGRGERVEVLAIPSSSQNSIFQREVLYLEEVTELLEMDSDSSDTLSSQYCSGPSPLLASANIKPEVHKLMHDLVIYIHKNEPDITKSILIFLPTYFSLEQQWSLLKPFSSCFKVHILHSSIDTVQALAAMKILKSHRKVILATNIAESSVTIPEVAYVIDSCRSLQIYWDGNKKIDAAKLVWVSKSQADQRKGRTGRTCDGQIYRMVTRSFFSNLEEFEFPAILKLSLRLHVLLICSAETKSINDPKALLQKALDSPDPEVVEDALSLLVNIKAINKIPRGRYEPTFYGRLLSSFSLSFDASVLIVKFGALGMLPEGILLGILMDTLPQPIVRPFGQDDLFRVYTSCYYADDDVDSALTGRKEVLFMSNLCAYQFWQRMCKDMLRVEHLKELLGINEVATNRALFSKFEEEWCSFHNLVQPSLCQISEIYHDILSTLHLYRPKFLASYSALPSYYEPYEFMHTCLQDYEESTEAISAAEDHEHSQIIKCLSMPFVTPHDFQARTVAQKFADIVKEIRLQNSEYLSGDQQENVVPASSYVEGAPLQCRFFAKGLCNRGYDCFYSHSLQAKPPVCQFFGSYRGCRYGDACLFTHDRGPSPKLSSMDSECIKEDENATQGALLKLFPAAPTEGCILLVNDDDLHFSENIAAHYSASKIIATTSVSETAVFNPSLSDVKILWGFRDLKQTFDPNQDKEAIPWDQVKCVLWFCKFQEFGDDIDGQKRLVRNFFELLATLMISKALYEVKLILIMKNIRFSQLQVEKLGRECFFFLKESFPFDERAFGEVRDGINLKKSMVSSVAISYVFTLHPPSELRRVGYGGELNHALVTHP